MVFELFDAAFVKTTGKLAGCRGSGTICAQNSRAFRGRFRGEAQAGAGQTQTGIVQPIRQPENLAVLNLGAVAVNRQEGECRAGAVVQGVGLTAGRIGRNLLLLLI